MTHRTAQGYSVWSKYSMYSNYLVYTKYLGYNKCSVYNKYSVYRKVYSKAEADMGSQTSQLHSFLVLSSRATVYGFCCGEMALTRPPHRSLCFLMRHVTTILAIYDGSGQKSPLHIPGKDKEVKIDR